MIKISGKYFQDFLRRATVGNLIEKYILIFTDEGLKFQETNVEMNCKGLINKSAFISYDNIGELYIGNAKLLYNIINRFFGDIELKVEGNILKIKGIDRDCEYVLSDKDSFKNRESKSYDHLKFDQTIKLQSNKIKEAVRNSDEIGTEDLIFRTEVGKLFITSGTTDKFVEKYDDREIIKPLTSKFGKPLKDVTTILCDEITIHMRSEYPIKIEMKTPYGEHSYVIAPKD